MLGCALQTTIDLVGGKDQPGQCRLGSEADEQLGRVTGRVAISEVLLAILSEIQTVDDMVVAFSNEGWCRRLLEAIVWSAGSARHVDSAILKLMTVLWSLLQKRP